VTEARWSGGRCRECPGRIEAGELIVRRDDLGGWVHVEHHRTDSAVMAAVGRRRAGIEATQERRRTERLAELRAWGRACPTCGAAIGAPCLSRSGRPTPHHVARSRP
jgi:hypothetical protein